MNNEELQMYIAENLNQLNTKYDKTEQTLKELKESIEFSNTTSQAALTEAKQRTKEVSDLRTELDKANLKNAQLTQKFDKLHERVIRMESQSRRDNLLFDGIPENKEENVYDIVQSIFKDNMKISSPENMKLVRYHRYGKRRPHGLDRPRPIIVKFHWYQDRLKVWKAKKNLAGSNIYVSEDFPQEIKERRAFLRPIMKKAKDDDKEAFFNVDNLIFEGRSYTVDTVNTLPKEYQPNELATPNIGPDMKAFYGKQSSCSNFSASKFSLDGIEWDCNERYYQKQKAQFAGDDNAGIRIMRASSAYECYKIGQELNSKINIEDWHKGPALTAMENGLKAKFEQNDHLKSFLLSTGERTLVEASKTDHFWGCGVALTDHAKLLDKDNWPGKNMLGQLLMRLRRSLTV